MKKFRGIIAKALLVVVFGLIIISFSLFGLGDILRGGSQLPTVASVGEVQITQQEYAYNFSRDLNRLQRQFGSRFTVQDAEAIGLPRSVLDRLIAERLFQAQAGDLGLALSDDLVRQEILSMQPFQDQLGQFSRARYDQALRNLQQSEEQFVASMRRDMKRAHLARAVTDGITPPRAMLEAIYAFENESRVAEYIRIAESSVELDAAATEEDLRSYHEDYAETFMAPAYRDVTAMTLTPEQMLGQIDISDEDLRQEYDASLEDLSVPERRQVEQALFDEEAQAQAFYEKLAGGSRFDVALQDFNGESPIDFGEISRTELSVLLPEGTDKAFTLAAGEVSEPFPSALGWHVLHVTEITPGSTPPFEEVKEQLRQDVTMARAIDDMIDLANDVDDKIAGGASLEEVAGSLGLSLDTIEGISREGLDRDGNPVEGLPSAERFLELAFSTEVGEQSLLTESDGGGYFILRVNGVTPPQVRPLDEVRADVERQWLQSQRREKTREIAEGYVEEIRNGASLTEIAERAGLEIQTTQPLIRNDQGPSVELVSQLFSVEVGEAVIAGGDAVQFVAVLDRIEAASADAAGIEALEQRLLQSLSNELLTLYSNDLQQRYGVEINEDALQNVLSGY